MPPLQAQLIPNSLPSKPRTDKVEYEFDIFSYKEKAELKRGTLTVKGNLKKNLDFWKNVIKANSFILSVIEQGYKIPFISVPTSINLRNNMSAFKHSKFVSTAIHELIVSGCITEQSSRPFCVNPLTVSVNKNGKERLILDLRHVNKFIKKQKIKFEGSKEALQYAKKGNFMIKYDLKSGYHHLDINKNFQKFLGFSWIEDEKEKFYVFTVLPFGLSSAPFLFTKMMRQIVKYWRSLSYPVIVYLDDGWCCHDFENCQKLSENIRKDLKSAGLVVNEDKSIWNPVKKLEWLGFLWDLELGSVEIPKKKIESFKESLCAILNSPNNVTARKLASVIGKIISMSFVLGNVCHIMTRNLHSPILNRLDWDFDIIIDQGAMNELKFWFNNCDTLPFRSISPIHRSVERIVYSDASDYAAAGVLLQSNNEVVHVMFDESDKNQSSTYRELKAVQFVLLSLRSHLSGRFVKLYTDNQNVVRIINVGSMKIELQKIALLIFELCLRYSIFLDIAWVPRLLNTTADFYSKLFDYDDWEININIFKFLNNKWGPYTFDRFADNKNFKVSKFNSQYWTPGTAGVDAFAFDWSGHNNWVVPPIHCIPNVINHMIYYKSFGTLIIPKW